MLDDAICLWKKSGLPVLSRVRVETKLKDILKEWKLAIKSARNKSELKEDARINELFDICKSQFEHMKVHNGEVFCSRSIEDGVVAVEIEFLMDQRGKRKIMLGSWASAGRAKGDACFPLDFGWTLLI